MGFQQDSQEFLRRTFEVLKVGAFQENAGAPESRPKKAPTIRFVRDPPPHSEAGVYMFGGF